MRVLVTGGRGFIGRHLVGSLRARQDAVILWPHDVRDLRRCAQTSDVVVHLAAIVRGDRFGDDAHEAAAVNVAGTLAALSYCHRVGARFVLASSSAVYRPSDEGRPLKEDAPIGPATPYGLSKWLAETTCKQAVRDWDVPSVVLRLFNVFGPGQEGSFLIPSVVGSLTQRMPVVVRTPEAVRDFVYVGDAVGALVAAAEVPSDVFRVYNIGSGRGVRVIDAVHTAEQVFGPATAIEAGARDDRSVVVADVSLARAELGWEPAYDLDAGLQTIRRTLKPTRA